MLKLIRVDTDPGELVGDFFCGAAQPALLACAKTGRICRELRSIRNGLTSPVDRISDELARPRFDFVDRPAPAKQEEFDV